MASQTVTGAKLKVVFTGTNGEKIIGYGNNVTYTLNHNVQPIEVFGQPEVNEHSELGTTVEFSVTHFRVNRKAAISLGIMPKLSAFLKQEEIKWEIIDSTKKNATMARITGVKCISRSGNVDSRGVLTETLNFVGRLFTDEEG